MIASSVQFISSQLDDYLKTETGRNTTLVKVSGLGQAIENTSLPIGNMLTISVVNIENDSRLARNTPLNRLQEGKAPPLYLDVSILISSSVKEEEYLDGLDFLSLAIRFFQQHSVFTSLRYTLAPGMERVNVELSSIDMELMNGLWVALGAPYRPSVIYKLRILSMDGEGDDEGLPVITRSDREV